MLCEHLQQLHHFVRENQLEIGGLDMIRLVCKKCNVQYECPQISVEYWEKEKQQGPPKDRP